MKIQNAPTTIIIVHGTYGRPQENWFPWLAKRVEELGHRSIVPALPTPENQSLDSWRVAFARQVGPLKNNMLLVGHSLGPAFILRLLEEATKPVIATFLVSGFLGTLGDPQFDSLNATFFEKPFDWERIKRNAGIIRLYYGDGDPYVPLEKGLELARELGEGITVIPKGGHLNAAAGFTKFERLLFDLTLILEFIVHRNF